jgi:predicted ATPase
MYISHISLKNIRGFKTLNLDLTNGLGKMRMHTIIIGTNGTGKTSLLRAISLGLCDREQANALIAEPNGRLISDNTTGATITLQLRTEPNSERSHRRTTRLRRRSERDVAVRQSPSVSDTGTIFVCGYGIGRAMEGPESGRAYQVVDSVYTLFRYDQTLIDTELTLRRLNDYLGTKRYMSTLQGIKRVLGLTDADEIELIKGGGIRISGPTVGVTISLDGWADGYRRSFNWILDIYGWAMRANKVTAEGGIEGILLVDEIEQHMHPSLQTNLIPRLQTLFPKLQVIATTHSPLVALGSGSENVTTLKRDGKVVVAVEDLPDFTGYSVEDVIFDDRLFDTSPYSSETTEKLAQFKAIASKPPARRTSREKMRARSLVHDLTRENVLMPEEEKLLNKLDEISKRYGV